MIPDAFVVEAFDYPQPTTFWQRLRAGLGRSHTPATHRHDRSEELAFALQRLLEPRLATATRPEEELGLIVGELRTLGHPLVITEDDPDWTIYADHPRANLAIWCHWTEGTTGRKFQKLEVFWQKM